MNPNDALLNGVLLTCSGPVMATEGLMLYDFIARYRNEIIARTRDRVRGRPWPSVSSGELEHGVPLFLTQLCETLRLETTETPFSSDAIGSTATRHGGGMLAAGFSGSQGGGEFWEIFQAVTQGALGHTPPLSL